MQNINDLRLSRDMKYEALYWALGFHELNKNKFTRNINGANIIIYSDKQYVEFSNKITIINGEKLDLTTHKSFVVLECVVKLLEMGYIEEEIIIDFDNEYDIYAKDLYIKCHEWGQLKQEEKSKFNKDIIKSISYSSRLASGMIERETLIIDSRNNVYTNGVFENEKRQKEYQLYNGKSFETKDFLIVNNKLIKYKGNDKTIVIPDGVTSLASCVFWDNQTVEEIVLPESLTDLGGDTFYNCFNLKKIHLNSNLKKMGNNPFAGCLKLNLTSNSKHFNLIDGALYNKDYSRLIYYDLGNENKNYNILEGTKIIGKHAFYLCNNIQNITIPKSVIKLENNPFSGCGNLSLNNYSPYYHVIDDVIYDKDKTTVIGCLNKIKTDHLKLLDVERISRNSFWNCKGIKAITFPKTLIDIGYNPFVGCNNIKFINESENFTVSNGVLYTKDKTKLICYPAHLSVGEITLDENVTTLERGAFSGSNQMTKINLKNVSVISKTCLTNCHSLEDVYCSDLISFIGEWAFAHCDNLKNVSVSKDAFIDKNILQNTDAILTIRDDKSNYIIESDNLYTLQSMNSNYKNKIDLIIIDPPYNSNIDYIGYKDSNFEEGYESFLKKRINLSKDLLTKNGAIVINIDKPGFKTVKKILKDTFNKVEVRKWEKLHPFFDVNRDVDSLKKRVKYEYVLFGFNGKKKFNEINKPYLKDNTLMNKKGKVPKTFKCFGTTSSAKDELKDIFGRRDYFQTPKPLKLIKEIIRSLTTKESIVLDYFAGSGTTGEAVINLNKEDNGRRKFILVTNDESNICKDVTLKRIERLTNNFVFL